jgi:hypothetical protein
MFDDTEREAIVKEIYNRVAADRQLLDDLVQDLRNYGLKSAVRQIRHYSTATLAIVSSDGGNASIKFDPFHHQLVRVVDSDGQTLAMKAITLTTGLDVLFEQDTAPDTDGNLGPIGLLVRDIRQATGDPIPTFKALCPSISVNPNRPEESAGWVISYRDLWEWAVIYHRLMYSEFAQSTLVIRDGLLRTKLFAKSYFRIIGDILAERIQYVKRKQRKDVYLVGLAKHSSVLDLYRLAWSMEDIFPAGSPYWVWMPRDIEVRAYKFPEFSWGRDRLPRNPDGLCASRDASGKLAVNLPDDGEDSKFVFGSMHVCRLGDELVMPSWAIDIFDDQVGDADRIMGRLYADALEGFPIPCYPQSIQRAHEAAKLTDFDADILNRAVMDGIRTLVRKDDIIDRFKLQGDITGRRY